MTRSYSYRAFSNGYPHGSAYIALFNLCFARRHGGQFILRIEDTDQGFGLPLNQNR